MRTAFQALGSVFVLFALAAGAARADEKVAKYTGMLDRNDCVPKLFADDPDNWLVKADVLKAMKEKADGKAKNYLAEECKQLDHGSFSQNILERLSASKDDYCEVSTGANDSCLSVTCFGYSAGTCTVPGKEQLAESGAPKAATFVGRATRFVEQLAHSMREAL